MYIKVYIYNIKNPLCAIGRNIKAYSCYRKLYGSSSENKK